jgi:hypothetical protein
VLGVIPVRLASFFGPALAAATYALAHFLSNLAAP